MGDVERAGHFESQALFLEALDALTTRDTVTARRKLERALRAYPEVAKEPEGFIAWLWAEVDAIDAQIREEEEREEREAEAFAAKVAALGLDPARYAHLAR